MSLQELWAALRSIIRSASSATATSTATAGSGGGAGEAEQLPRSDEVAALMDYLGAKMEQLQDSEEK